MPICQGLGWACIRGSLLLHAVTVFSFSFQPDFLAAFTVIPIWLWACLGIALALAASYYAQTRFALILAASWLVTALVGSEEVRSCIFPKPAETLLPSFPQARHAQSIIRVASLNCSIFSFGNPGNDLASWHPDIVLLQDTYSPQVRALSQTLHAGHGHFQFNNTNGIISRWTIKNPVLEANQRNQQVTIAIPNFGDLVTVNLHLLSAATDLRLWNPSAWRDHRNTRILRRKELTDVLTRLKKTTDSPHSPTLIGGDFNAPNSDPVHSLLKPHFIDSFKTVGTFCGNTYPRRFPLLRIDHIYASHHLTPIRSRTIETRHSDHRIVITDYQINKIPRNSTNPETLSK
jgi:endonuclease/exonuclease/phosphatase (EEP) superfamily protein YafD